MAKITKQELEQLDDVRKELNRLTKLNKELTSKLIAKAGTDTEKAWKDIGYTITEGHTTSANAEEIKKLPDWEKYYKTTYYPKLTITRGK